MGQIFNVRDFNRYIGTYSRCMRRRTVEKRIGWYIPDILYARIPTIALRNLNEDPKKEWIMHFLFPELFPIWDTYWIKNKAPVKEDYALPEDLEEELSLIYDASYEYASYVNLMIRDQKQITVEELNNLKKAFVRRCIKHGEMSDASVVDEFFWDINPILFEICLLGKHC